MTPINNNQMSEKKPTKWKTATYRELGYPWRRWEISIVQDSSLSRMEGFVFKNEIVVVEKEQSNE